MKQQIDRPDLCRQFRHVYRVADMGIRQRFVGRRCQHFVWNDGSVGPDEVGAFLYGTDLSHGNLMIGDHVGPYVTQARLLLEDISDGRNPVTERYGPDSEGGGLEYHGLLRPDDIESQVEGQVTSEKSIIWVSIRFPSSKVCMVRLPPAPPSSRVDIRPGSPSTWSP